MLSAMREGCNRLIEWSCYSYYTMGMQKYSTTYLTIYKAQSPDSNILPVLLKEAAGQKSSDSHVLEAGIHCAAA
jgi:hypothetical protein